MTIRSIIIDDEAHNIGNTRTLLQNFCPQVQVVATAASADEGIAAIHTHRPDLIFLDIQMPERTGFDLLKAFPKIDFEIIFITAFDQYGIQAIKFSALDYLLKPIDHEELKKAVEKAIDTLTAKRKNHSIDNLLEYIKKGNRDLPKIALPTLNEIMYVKVDEIIRCEASNNYTNFFLSDGGRVLVCKTLKEFSELLKPYEFLRTHQSHLVNIHYVKSYLKEDGGTLLMKDGSKIPISRQNRDLVKEALNRSW
jgi:two-component system LytT family response regulator